MLRTSLHALIVAALLFVAAAHAREPIRIDASTEATTRASFEAMTASLSPRKQQALQIAVLVLNMDGVSSAYEAVNNPELQHPSIERIRNTVSGMTAEEIIRRSKRVKSVRVTVQPSERAAAASERAE